MSPLNVVAKRNITFMKPGS